MTLTYFSARDMLPYVKAIMLRCTASSRQQRPIVMKNTSTYIIAHLFKFTTTCQPILYFIYTLKKGRVNDSRIIFQAKSILMKEFQYPENKVYSYLYLKIHSLLRIVFHYYIPSSSILHASPKFVKNDFAFQFDFYFNNILFLSTYHLFYFFRISLFLIDRYIIHLRYYRHKVFALLFNHADFSLFLQASSMMYIILDFIIYKITAKVNIVIACYCRRIEKGWHF